MSLRVSQPSRSVSSHGPEPVPVVARHRRASLHRQARQLIGGGPPPGRCRGAAGLIAGRLDPANRCRRRIGPLPGSPPPASPATARCTPPTRRATPQRNSHESEHTSQFATVPQTDRTFPHRPTQTPSATQPGAEQFAYVWLRLSAGSAPVVLEERKAHAIPRFARPVGHPEGWVRQGHLRPARLRGRPVAR
jgi:hypothetical protein